MQWDVSCIQILQMAVVNLHSVHQIKMEIHFSFFLHPRINEYGLIEIFYDCFVINNDEKYNIMDKVLQICNEPE